VQDRVSPLVGLEAQGAADRAETFTAWRTLLESLAADGPAVVVIEDLHWADDALVGFLAEVADRTAGIPLLVVVTARPEVEDRHPSWFARARRSTVLSLPPLADRDVAALVSSVLPAATPEMTAAVLERAGGSPLYAEQLAASVREGEGAADPSAVPATVQALVAARLDTLSPDVKSLVQDAAVVGRTFWPGVLATLGDRDPAQVGSMIDDLIRRELVRPSVPSTMADERELAFWHSMVRDVAYSSIPRVVRMAKHRAVAEWLNEHAGGEDLADATAQHLVRAAELAAELGRHEEEESLREPMLAALVRAGDRARRMFAADVAVDRYDRAVPLAEQAGSDDVLARLLLSRGEVLEQLGRFDQAQADYEAARDAAGRAGLPTDEARALAALSHVLWLQDRYDDGERVMALALGHAREAGANDLVAHLLYTAGTIAFGRARFDEALGHHQEAIRVARENGDTLGEAMSLHGLCETRFFLGPFSRSLADGLEADRAFRALGQRPMVFHNLYMVAWAHWLRGELHASLAAFDESIEGCRELGNRRDEGFAMSRGMAHLLLGDLGAAAADPTHAIELAAEMRTPRMDLSQRSVRMHAWAELGAADRLRVDLDTCEELSSSLGGSFYRPRSFAWEGWFALRDGDASKAAGLFEEGLREAGGVQLDVVWNSWIELLGAEEHGDPNTIRTAAAHLAEGAGDDALGLVDWVAYGMALAEALEGGNVDAEAGWSPRRTAAATGCWSGARPPSGRTRSPRWGT
jgi:tetratricopeptide (TPR) repeat protein